MADLAAPQMQAVAPFLLVSDVKAAARHYDDAYGFKSEMFWGDPPMFTIVRREGLSVMLRQVLPHESFKPIGDYADGLDAYFTVRDADALHAEFKTRGANVLCDPETQPYMMREFSVRDLDGHVLTFAHDTSNQDA